MAPLVWDFYCCQVVIFVAVARFAVHMHMWRHTPGSTFVAPSVGFLLLPGCDICCCCALRKSSTHEHTGRVPVRLGTPSLADQLIYTGRVTVRLGSPSPTEELFFNIAPVDIRVDRMSTARTLRLSMLVPGSCMTRHSGLKRIVVLYAQPKMQHMYIHPGTRGPPFSPNLRTSGSVGTRYQRIRFCSWQLDAKVAAYAVVS